MRAWLAAVMMAALATAPLAPVFAANPAPKPPAGPSGNLLIDQMQGLCFDTHADPAKADAAAQTAGWTDLFPKGQMGGLEAFFFGGSGVHRQLLVGADKVWLIASESPGKGGFWKRSCSMQDTGPGSPDLGGSLTRLFGHAPLEQPGRGLIWAFQDGPDGRRFLNSDAKGNFVDVKPDRALMIVVIGFGSSSPQTILYLEYVVGSPQAEQWAACSRNENEPTDPDVVIAACTAFIDSQTVNRGLLAQALNDRGFARHHKNDLKGAEQDFRQALALSPGAPTWRLNLARVLVDEAFTTTDDELAVALDREALGILQGLMAGHRDTSEELQALAGSATARLHRTDEAIAYFSKAIRLEPKNDYALGERCFTRTVARVQLAQALSDCNRAIALEPREPEYRDSRGWLFVAMKRHKDAVAEFDAALALDPKLASSLFGRGMAELALGQRERADADFAAARAIDPTVKAPFLRP